MLQKQALALYREVIRVANGKYSRDGGKARELKMLAREEFEKHRNLGRADFSRIEHFIRRGRRQLQVLKGTDVSSISIKHGL